MQISVSQIRISSLELHVYLTPLRWVKDISNVTFPRQNSLFFPRTGSWSRLSHLNNLVILEYSISTINTTTQAHPIKKQVLLVLLQNTFQIYLLSPPSLLSLSTSHFRCSPAQLFLIGPYIAATAPGSFMNHCCPSDKDDLYLYLINLLQ